MTSKASLSNNSIALSPTFITVYNYDGQSYEYISSSVEYLAAGVSIPANSCIDPPGEYKEGFSIFRDVDLSIWIYVPDHRGETVFYKHNGESVLVNDIGHLSENVVSEPPDKRYVKWDGKSWVADKDAELKASMQNAVTKKEGYIKNALTYINNRQWPGKAALGLLDDEEKINYKEVINYIDELNAIIPADLLDVRWPEKPF